MNYSTQNYSLSDLAAVTGRNNYNNDGIFGGGGGGWFIGIIALFLIFSRFGWGGFGGWGGMDGGSSGGVANNYVLASDFGQIDRKLDGISNGICDATYALNNTVTNGFAAAQQTMTQGFAGLNTGMIQQGYEGRIATNAVGNQLQQCCCDVRGDLAGINYNLATQSNAIQNTVTNGFCQANRGVERGFADMAYAAATNTTSIIQSQHNDTDRVIQKLCDIESNRQAEKIAALQAENQGLRFAASQQAQNNYLVNTLTDKLGQPCAKPAYLVANPSGPLNYSTTRGGCPCAA